MSPDDPMPATDASMLDDPEPMPAEPETMDDDAMLDELAPNGGGTSGNHGNGTAG